MNELHHETEVKMRCAANMFPNVASPEKLGDDLNASYLLQNNNSGWKIFKKNHQNTAVFGAQVKWGSSSDQIQLKSDETAQFLNKPYVNEVTLRGQK